MTERLGPCWKWTIVSARIQQRNVNEPSLLNTQTHLRCETLLSALRSHHQNQLRYAGIIANEVTLTTGRHRHDVRPPPSSLLLPPLLFLASSSFLPLTAPLSTLWVKRARRCEFLLSGSRHTRHALHHKHQKPTTEQRVGKQKASDRLTPSYIISKWSDVCSLSHCATRFYFTSSFHTFCSANSWVQRSTVLCSTSLQPPCCRLSEQEHLWSSPRRSIFCSYSLITAVMWFSVEIFFLWSASC